MANSGRFHALTGVPDFGRMSWPDPLSLNMWALLGSLPLLCALGIYTWRHRDAPAAAPILLLLLLRTFWIVFRLLELVTEDFETKLLWFRLAQAIIPVMFATGISVLAEFTRPRLWLGRRNVALLYAPALMVGALILSNSVHGLMRNRLWLDEFVHVALGPLAWVLFSYFICFYLVVAIRLVRLATRWSLFHWPAGVLLAGSSIAIAVYMLVAAGLVSRTPIDPTILVLDFNLALYVLAAIGFRQVLSVLPVAREMAIEHMKVGIVILSTQGRVMFQNPAARGLLSYPWSISGGRKAAGVTSLVALAGRAIARPTEILADIGAECKHYSVQVTQLEDPRGWFLGDLLIFQDITDRIRARQVLVQQQRMRAVQDERERIAGELHDNLGQVLGYVKLQAQAVRDLLSGEDYDNAERVLTQLVSVAQEAHTDVYEFLLGARTTAMLDRGFTPALEGYLEQMNDNFGLKTQLHIPPDWDEASLEPSVAVQLLRIVQEALTNARKHAQAKTVTVSLATLNSQGQISVQDDGQGFDLGQLVGDQGLSFGLGYMRQRAEGVGGTLEVQSARGQGTQVIVRVPLQNDWV